MITSNGAIVLQVPRMPEGETLAGVQEFALMVSDDLVNWEEMSRSRLKEDLEVADFGASGRPARFYRVVGLSVDETIRLFAEELKEELAELTEYASGILLDGVRLSEYEEMQSIVAETRADILELLESGAVVPESLLLFYQESIGGIDQMLASSPLRITWEGEEYEIEVSSAMKALSNQYKRLGTVELNDYDRLPGIDASDLEGHESLKDYLDTRRPGLVAALPVFESLSPYGNYTLIHALALKHMDILSESDKDDDLDGAIEIDYAMFARLLNGAERCLREGRAMAEELRQKHDPTAAGLSKSPLSDATFGGFLSGVDGFLSELDLELVTNVKDKGYEEVFETQLLAEANGIYSEEEHVFVEALEDEVRPPSKKMELISEYEGGDLGSVVRPSEILSYRNTLESWNLSLESSIKDFLDGLDLSARWRVKVDRALGQKLHGYSGRSGYVKGLYESAYSVLENALNNSDVSVQVTGVGQVLLKADDEAWKAFPRTVAELAAISGISSVLSEEELEAFSKQSEWETLRKVNLDGSELWVDDYISVFGIRIQLMNALLASYGEALVVDGELDGYSLVLTVYRDEELGESLASVKQAVDEGIEDLEALGLSGESWFSPDQFDRILDSVEAVKSAVNAALREGGTTLHWQQNRFFSYLARAQYDLFLDSLEETAGLTGRNLWQKRIRIDLDGTDYLVDSTWLKARVVSAVNRVGYVYLSDGRVTLRQLDRLADVDTSEVLELRQVPRWDNFLSLDDRSYYGSAEDLDRISLDAELYFVFIPRLLEVYGENILKATGGIDNELLEERLLLGLEPEVPFGSSLQRICKEIAESRGGAALAKLNSLSDSEWSTWEAIEEAFLQAKVEILDESGPYLADASDIERTYLVQEVERFGSLYVLRDRFRDLQEVDAVTLRFGNGESWLVPLKKMRSAVGLSYYHVLEDRSVYSGLSDEDYAASHRFNPYLSFLDGVDDPEALHYEEWVDQSKLLIAVLRRLHDSPDSVPELYRDSIVSDSGSVVVEVLRRYVVGVDNLHFAMVEEARQRSNEISGRLDAILKAPLTIEKVEEAYGLLAELNRDLNAYLSDATRRFRADDVLEVEEGVSAEYQSAFAILLDAMRSHPLTVVLEGESVVVPYESISRRLLGELGKRYPGEVLAAHHFASLYGLSVADLRRYDKLEVFFGRQIVALPRNSSYVEVVSKLSDIGMRQLVVDLVLEYGSVVYDAGTGIFDVEALVAMVSDETLGRERALARANELFDGLESALEELGEAVSLQDLEMISFVLSNKRTQLRASLADDVSALSEESLVVIQEYVDGRYAQVLDQVSGYVFGREIRIDQIDGGQVAIDISEYEDGLAEEIERLVGLYPIEDSSSSRVVVYGFGIDRSFGYVGPRDRFDRAETLTRFGFHVLIGRLVAAYGDTVVSEGGFDFEAFVEQLERTDEDRAAALIDRLIEIEEARWLAVSPDHEDAVLWDDAKLINARFDASYGAFSRLYRRLETVHTGWSRRSDVDQRLNDEWTRVRERYEIAMGDRDVIVEVDGAEVLISASSLLERLDAAYDDGAVGLLDSYAIGLESTYGYSEKEYLWSFDIYPFFSNAEQSGSDGVKVSGLYPFTLGDLQNLPGVSNADLQRLDVEGDNHVTFIPTSAKELMTGILNLRVLAPGSGVEVVGSQESGYLSVNGSSIDSAWRYMYMPVARTFDELSWRARRFDVLIELILDYFDEVVDENGDVDLDALERVLMDAEEET
ncbi:hypothetical protein VDG1235_2503 [Verrucomicrobiia bacterium DG1235]|nr:hypothetical protein VDG1235_2503 [Verrucomicrobiae bacterium DG1235]